MRAIFVALALAGALIPFAHARAGEPRVRVAQMTRDVTDAVRIQRSARTPPRPHRKAANCEARR